MFFFCSRYEHENVKRFPFPLQLNSALIDAYTLECFCCSPFSRFSARSWFYCAKKITKIIAEFIKPTEKDAPEWMQKRERTIYNREINNNNNWVTNLRAKIFHSVWIEALFSLDCVKRCFNGSAAWRWRCEKGTKIMRAKWDFFLSF